MKVCVRFLSDIVFVVPTAVATRPPGRPAARPPTARGRLAASAALNYGRFLDPVLGRTHAVGTGAMYSFVERIVT